MSQQNKTTKNRRGCSPAEYMRVYRAIRAGKLTSKQAVKLGLWAKRGQVGRPSQLPAMIASAKAKAQRSARRKNAG